MHWDHLPTAGRSDPDGVLFVQIENFFRRKGHSAEEATVMAYYAMDDLEKWYEERTKGKSTWIWAESGPEDYDKYWVCPHCGERSYIQSNYCPDCGKALTQQMPKMKGE